MGKEEKISERQTIKMKESKNIIARTQTRKFIICGDYGLLGCSKNTQSQIFKRKIY